MRMPRTQKQPWRTALGCAAVLVFALLGTSARAPVPQPVPSRLPDVQTLGPQVGSRVPDFTLLDQRGQSRTLASLMGRSGLMLVFFRSADW